MRTRRAASPLPTPAELEILHVLWEVGPSTVRNVFERLSAEKDIQYTTVLKLLQIMHTKGLVERAEDARAHTYSAKAPAEDSKKSMVNDLVARVFGGSSKDLVMRAITENALSASEREEIRKLLDDLDRGGKS